MVRAMDGLFDTLVKHNLERALAAQKKLDADVRGIERIDQQEIRSLMYPADANEKEPANKGQAEARFAKVVSSYANRLIEPQAA